MLNKERRKWRRRGHETGLPLGGRKGIKKLLIRQNWMGVKREIVVVRPEEEL